MVSFSIYRYSFFAALALIVTGCGGIVRTPYEGTNEYSGIENGHNPFGYRVRPVTPEWRKIESDGDDLYDQYELIFPPTEPDKPFEHDFKAIYYQSKLPAAKPLIVILPIWASYTYPSEKMGDMIRKKSRGTANVLLVDGEEPLFDWYRMRDAATEQEFKQLGRLYHQKTRLVVVGLRRLIDWAGAESDLDEDRVGIVGFSMGAIVATMALGSEQRFGAGVLVMGAGNFGEVFATCDGKPAQVRDSIMPRFDWTIDEYQAFYDELFVDGDPGRFIGRFQPEKMLIVEAALDNCMSTEAREALWQATGQPERIRLLARHKPAFISMTPVGLHYTTRQIYGFLEKQLDIVRDPEQCAAPGSSCRKP